MKSVVGKIFKVVILIFLVLIIVLGAYVFSIANAVNFNENVMMQERASLEIYDKSGNLISLSGYKKNLAYDEIPQNLINAFICIEDKNYFSHSGVDFGRIVKAMVKNIISMSPSKEGASTITQQFIKNTHLSIEKTYKRKIQEIKLAMDLERIYSKEEIITAYFNILYFGNSIYGVSSACENFFGKECKDLTLSECATLAGIVKNPAKYSPLRNYQNSVERRNFILKEMLKDGMITSNQYSVAEGEVLKIVGRKNRVGVAFVDAVIDEATSILGISENDLAYGSYKIYTDYDPKLQEEIENTLNSDGVIPLSDSGKKADAYALVTNNESCLVSAYHNSYPCRIRDFYRQPGSTIKPFVSYLPAISKSSLSPASPVLDEAININNYSPSNFGGKYYGWTSARVALSKSLNSVAVKLMNENGVSFCVDYAKKYGLNFDEKDYCLATALGGMTKGVNPIEISSAYMTLANGGYYKEASFIKCIKSDNDTALYNKDSIPFSLVESEENVYLMTDMLMECAKTGTASRLGVRDYHIASKTGTVSFGKTAKNNDIWNVAYTTQNTVCVWMGNVDNSRENALNQNASAGVYPTFVVSQVLDCVYQSKAPYGFPIPSGIVERAYSKRIYEEEHLLAEPSDLSVSSEVCYDIFHKDTVMKIDSDINIVEDFEGFCVKITNNFPIISFVGKRGVNYTVIKYSILSGEEVVDAVNGKGELIELIDKNVIPGLDYVYKIDATVTNYKDEVVHLKTSEEKFVMLPYDLWGD